MDTNTAMARAWDRRVSLMRVAVSIVRRSQDAEDAVSNAILQAGCAAGSLRDERRFDAWLMRILVRCCYDILRRSRRESPGELPEQPVFEREGGELWAALRTLSPPYRRVLILYYYEGFKAREIASILGVPIGTVLARLARGRAKLKDMIAAEEACTP